MNLSVAATRIFTDGRLTIVRVQSARCHYRVSVVDDEATVYGPGVEEVYPLDALGPSTLPPEAHAVIAVLLLEEE